jgi:hypothetical protein
MPPIRLTKRVIDALPAPASDIVYWDSGCPGFGVKVTPKGRKVFIVLYRIGGAGSKLRKYTIGPYGRVTLHQARVNSTWGYRPVGQQSLQQAGGKCVAQNEFWQDPEAGPPLGDRREGGTVRNCAIPGGEGKGRVVTVAPFVAPAREAHGR